MIFSDFTRSESGNVILFKNTTPIDNVGSLKFFKDNAKGSFSKKEFRWSFNTNYWASWEPLNQGNFTRINVKGSCLFIEIRYVGTGTVTRFSVNYEEKAVSAVTSTSNGVDVCETTVVEQAVTSQTIKNYDEACAVDNPTLVDADTLCGRNCEYYLWRPNHKGEQPISSIENLQQILTNLTNSINNASVTGADNVDQPGIGVYYDRIDKTLAFKTIVGENRIGISENTSGKITIQFEGDAITDASLGPDFVWLNNKLYVTGGGGGGVSYAYVDGSLGARDASIEKLFINKADLIYVDGSLGARDASLEFLFNQDKWFDTDPVSATVGGIYAGDTFDGSTAIGILDKMLYEYYPSIVNLVLNPSSGYYEKYDVGVGTATISGNFNNSNFVKVRVTDVSSYVSVDGGAIQPTNVTPTHISYPDVSSGTFSFFDGSFPNWEDVIYHIKTYNNVNGKIMPALDSSISLIFVNSYRYGVIDVTNTDISVGTNPIVLENLIKTLDKIPPCPKQTNNVDFIKDPSFGLKLKFIYAYDASYGDLDSIFDVRNDFNVTSSFDSTIINLTGIGPNPIPYKVYIKNHWIDVDSFKLIFNI